MNTTITRETANEIIMRAIDRAAINCGLARDGHSQTDGNCRWSGDCDASDAQALTEDCWTFVCAESAVYDWSSEDALARDVEASAVVYISARIA